MKKILFIMHKGNIGGPAKSLLKIIKYLPADFLPHVLIPSEGDLKDLLDKVGISNTFFSFRYRNVVELTRLIRAEKIDIIYGNSFSKPAYLGLLAAKLTFRPFIWHIREKFPIKTNYWSPYFNVRFADSVIAVSNATASSVYPYLFKKKINVVHNGVEIQDFDISKTDARKNICKTVDVQIDDVLLINVGIICARKNQIDVIKAASEVIKLHPNVKILFLGRVYDQSYFDEMKHIADNLEISSNIFYIGFIEKINEFYCGADVLVHTPIKDPHPRVVLEAMAAGLPVVASAVDGIRETVLHNETGFLAPPGSLEDLSSALDKLIENPDLRVDMGQKGRKRIETMFTAKRTADQINKLIIEILER